MTRNDFLKELVDLMQLDSELTLETDLTSLEEYDSLMALSIMAMVNNELGVTLTADQMISVVKVSDLVNAIGQDKFE